MSPIERRAKQREREQQENRRVQVTFEKVTDQPPSKKKFTFTRQKRK